MPIQISQSLIKKLPERERTGVEAKLWKKSGKLCFLCTGKMIESVDKIVADHDIPESESGKTTLRNLNLVHDGCNSFKRNHPTVSVRPYLTLAKKFDDQGGVLKYGDAIKLLGICAKPLDLVQKASRIEITTPDGKTTVAPVFSERNKSRTFRFCFVDLPKNALFNDDECQPRIIKLQHLWQIYSDVTRNPLHEAPACRIMKVKGSISSHKALLFDGQHKAMAFWIDERDSIVTKIYLDLDKDAAVRLVNSVQAKIKKLPLSPFELAAKMAEEWQERVSNYESQIGTENASESGFIAWVNKDERSRAKAAFEDALFENIIDNDSLDFRALVLRPGEKGKTIKSKITEATFKNKLLKPLLHTAPLDGRFEVSQKLRQQEADIIVRLFNILYQKAFAPKGAGELSPQDEMRAKRLVYQSSLNYVAELLRRCIGYRLVVDSPRELLDKPITPEIWELIHSDIDRLLAHPVWTADLEHSEKSAAVGDALSKNQNAESAFADIGLKLGYVVGADTLSPTCLD